MLSSLFLLRLLYQHIKNNQIIISNSSTGINISYMLCTHIHKFRRLILPYHVSDPSDTPDLSKEIYTPIFRASY